MLFSEYNQEQKSYPYKNEVSHKEIMLPPHAPPEYADRNALWNSAEAQEKQWNSQLAQRFVLAIPREIPLERIGGQEDRAGNHPHWEAAVELEAYLRQRSRDKKAIAVEKNATGLSYMLQGAGFYHLFPSYQFDSGRMEFQALSGCDMLGYIQKKPYITVKDMVAFRLSSSDNSD